MGESLLRRTLLPIILFVIACNFLTVVAWADCASPAGTAGKVIFEAETASMQYCNGASWVNFPKQVPPSGWKQIASNQEWSDTFACGITNDGRAWCWGNDTWGRLGNGATLTAMQTAPSLVAGGHTWKQITVGDQHACGIRTDNVAMCWGGAGAGAIGNGSTSDQDSPVTVSGGHSWAKLSAGWGFTCGIRTDGAGYCWGSDSNGKLGNGATGSVTSPGTVNGGYSWADISAGDNHGCGVTTSGTGYCWGEAAVGKLGNGTTSPNVQTPSLVLGGHTWLAIDAGSGNRSCGLTSAGVAYCWGLSWEGRLGNGTTSPDVSSPSLVSGSHQFRAIDVGNDSSCGLRTDNSLYCWGSEAWGSAGFSGIRSSPTNVSHGHTWSSVDGGASIRCGIRTDGVAMCMGRADHGALGNGDPGGGDQYSPVLVREAASACTMGNFATSTAYDNLVFSDISFGNGLFFAAENSGDSASHGVWTSSDGMTWSRRHTINEPLMVTAYGNGIYIAFQSYWNSQVVRSTDGINWTTHYNATPFAPWTDAVYGNGIFMAVAWDGNPRAATSTDGITWTGSAIPTDTEWVAVAYGNGRFVAVTNQWNATNTAAVSTNNGSSWTANAGPGTTINDIIFGEGLFVAVGGGGDIRTSSDGVTWTNRPTGVGHDWRRVAYGNGIFLTISNNGNYASSLDGITWTVGSGTPPNEWGDIAYGNGRFVAGSWGDWGNDDIERLASISCIGTCASPTEPAGTIMYNADRRVMQWCDGTRWQSMGPDNPGGASGGCSNPAGGAGNILYNSSYNIPQYCDGGTWRAIGLMDVCQQAGTTAGTVCSDGSVYAGLSPDGNARMYTTPADTSSGTPWNNNNASGYTTTGQTSAITGAANTANLTATDSDSVTGGTQPHQANQLCADLTAHGYSDWYLPAKNELNVLHSNKIAIGGFNITGTPPAGYYWSSTEINNSVAENQNFSSGSYPTATKNGWYSVRCVRKR